MLAEALQAEVDAYIAQFVHERDERGRRLVVRNGSHRPREVLTSAGAVEVVAPRVNDRRVDPDTGERMRVLLGDPAALVPQDPEGDRRSEEHTSELQSRQYLVCRLLLEKKKK